MSNRESITARTLIIDDQPDVLEALGLLLKSEGFQTEAVTSPTAVLDAIQANTFDILLMDLNYARDTTSGQEGLDLLTHVQALDSSLPVVVMTAWGSVELAVEAMRRGVRDSSYQHSAYTGRSRQATSQGAKPESRKQKTR